MLPSKLDRLVRAWLAGLVVLAFNLEVSHPLTLADEKPPEENASTAATVEEFHREVAPILERYCYSCHADGGAEGDFVLDGFASDEMLAKDADTWWAVLKNVRADVMPPDGEERPTEAEKRALFDWITGRVFSWNRESLDPGPVTLRRLNRMEYRNTIRDLMGVDFDTSVEFPPDDTGDGFDNNADALSISPLLTEKYIDAARDIVERAVPKTARVISVLSIEPKDFEAKAISKSNRLSFDEAGTAVATFNIKEAANYRIIIPIEIDGSFDFDSTHARVQLHFDEESLHDEEYGWRNDFELEVAIERQLSKGEHSVHFEVTPIEASVSEDRAQEKNGTFVRLQIPTVRIEGPLDPATWKKPEGYGRFFHLDEPPLDASARVEYATEVLRRFCRRAYRGPVDQRHLTRLLDLAGLSDRNSGPNSDSPSFEQRIGRAMTAVLASPRFLFRVEKPRVDSDGPYPEIDDYALASRLSYFLWSTMPDEELFQLAEQGVLRMNLDSQVARMLRDERSDSLIDNFVGQWLQTRDVTSVSIDTLAALGVREEYEKLSDYLLTTESGRRPPPENAEPEHQDAFKRYQEIRALRTLLDDDVRRDMGLETKRLFAHVLREDRSVVELIHSNYAFLNERLANHYGVPGVEGDKIRKVPLPEGSALGGVLTQGTFLLVTSNPTRTSPVKRGLFILDNILGTPAPPAPALVPELEESADHSEMENPTLRQLLEIHRSEALCRSCHARFDPLGLAFENFTAIGTWRNTENGQPIMAGGRLISGEEFENATELKSILAGPRRLDFYRCLSERMLSYAIGRSLDFGDEIAIEQITRDLDQNAGRAQRIINGVVSSTAFNRMRRPGTQSRLP